MYAYDSTRHSVIWLRTQFSIVTLNLTSFTLTGKTQYHQYLYALESNDVPIERLVPLTFPHLTYPFMRDKLYLFSKRFHDDFVIDSERYCLTSYTKHFASLGESIATLCEEKDYWWCDFCTKPLFKTCEFVFF